MQNYAVRDNYEDVMDTITAIRFRPVTVEAIPEIAPLLEYSESRTCDYTVAGLLMWAEYFNYEYAVVDGTLFIKGVDENDLATPAFSMPIGMMPLPEALRLVAGYCRRHGLPLRFSAVPEDRLADFYSLGACRIEELTDWTDYLYDAEALATLQGNRYSKKRNHVNRFMTENPRYTYRRITPDMISEVTRFYSQLSSPKDLTEPTAAEERRQVFKMLEQYPRLPFTGAVLSTPADGIVAFTIGEIIGDTLYVHIEKMSHSVNGAGETINRMFADDMLHARGIAYINREEDVGDEGLRKAKMSYHPVMLLKKYDLAVDE